MKNFALQSQKKSHKRTRRGAGIASAGGQVRISACMRLKRVLAIEPITPEYCWLCLWRFLRQLLVLVVGSSIFLILLLGAGKRYLRSGAPFSVQVLPWTWKSGRTSRGP